MSHVNHHTEAHMRLVEAKQHEAGSVEERTALDEAQIQATLAVSDSLSYIEDRLSEIRDRLSS